MIKYNWQDKRKYQRFHQIYFIRYRLHDRQGVGYETHWDASLVGDISLGGLAFVTKNPYILDDVLEVTLRMSKHVEALPCYIRVVRSEEETKDVAFKTACSFISINESKKYFIEEILTGGLNWTHEKEKLGHAFTYQIQNGTDHERGYIQDLGYHGMYFLTTYNLHPNSKIKAEIVVNNSVYYIHGKVSRSKIDKNLNMYSAWLEFGDKFDEFKKALWQDIRNQSLTQENSSAN